MRALLMLLRCARRVDLRGEYGSQESENPCFGVSGVWISGVVEWVGVVTVRVSILTDWSQIVPSDRFGVSDQVKVNGDGAKRVEYLPQTQGSCVQSSLFS